MLLPGLAGVLKPATVSDPYTVLLTHFDGADSSTTITDSTSRHSPAAQGSAQIDTSQSKFGGASLQINTMGTDYVLVPDSSDWSLGDGDFTIEGWVRFPAQTGGGFALFEIGSGSDGKNMLMGLINLAYKPALYLYVSDACKVDATSGDALSNDAWHHVACVRSGDDWLMFADGTKVAEHLSVTDSVPEPTYLRIGSTIRFDSYCTGTSARWIDEFRVSKGIARWTSNFTPPTTAYSP